MRSVTTLVAAVMCEVAATLALRASQDDWRWLILAVSGYVAGFVLLVALMRAGMAVGVTYGLWGASGTALTATLATVLFDEAFTWPMVTGLGLIIAGVLFVELGSRGAQGAT